MRIIYDKILKETCTVTEISILHVHRSMANQHYAEESKSKSKLFLFIIHQSMESVTS